MERGIDERLGVVDRPLVRDLTREQQQPERVIVALAVPDLDTQGMYASVFQKLHDRRSARLTCDRPEHVPVLSLPGASIFTKLDLQQPLGVHSADTEISQKLVRLTL